jgi:hypothetical protein
MANLTEAAKEQRENTCEGKSVLGTSSKKQEGVFCKMRDFSDLQREALGVRRDMAKAYNIISDAKARYIKTKLKARSKKQTGDNTLLFGDLEPYSSKDEIQEVLGYGDITITEYDRLMLLWREREKQSAADGKYSDRVIEMIDKVLWRIGDEYQALLEEYDELNRENEKNQQGTF